MLTYDAIVVGGGFFGCQIAIELRRLGLARVALLEREAQIMQRASQWNQARVHRGYHYPRDTVTGLRSAQSYRRFIEEFASCVAPTGLMHYAIARNSKITATQFEQFCRSIDIPLWSPALDMKMSLDFDLIEAVYRVEETVFNCHQLATIIREKIAAYNINLLLQQEVIAVKPSQRTIVETQYESFSAPLIFNTTYAALDQWDITLHARLKREWVELALIAPPAALGGGGLTVMDGSYFSIMPFPSRGCHSLSHVRYTPIQSWTDKADMPQIKEYGLHPSITGVAMKNDVSRYLPAFKHVNISQSFFDVKAVLVETEATDARPILLERNFPDCGIYSILGAKIDNIYDVLDSLPALLH